MDEIRVNHSIGRSCIDLAADAVCIAIGIFALQRGVKPAFLCWFLIIVFALLGLTLLHTIVKERVDKRPYLIIKDDSIVLDSGKQREIRFEDVESFEIAKVPISKVIAVKFYNERAQDVVFAGDLTIRWKDLLNILNERLEAAKKAEA